MGKEGLKKGWCQRMAARYAQPRQEDLILIRGQRGVTVYGCRRILHYSPDHIDLQSGKRVVGICGSGLICIAFSGGSATVRGRIQGVSFLAPGEDQEENLQDV